jgi:ABC-type thiamin/hydroxymethylpyrimidine transport system permease subunit
MRHLPGRAWRLNNIWTIVCAVLGLVFFVLVRGWEVLGNALAVWLHTAPAQDVFQLNTLTIVLSVLMLMALGTYQLVSKELRR